MFRFCSRQGGASYSFHSKAQQSFYRELAECLCPVPLILVYSKLGLLQIRFQSSGVTSTSVSGPMNKGALERMLLSSSSVFVSVSIEGGIEQVSTDRTSQPMRIRWRVRLFLQLNGAEKGEIDVILQGTRAETVLDSQATMVILKFGTTPRSRSFSVEQVSQATSSYTGINGDGLTSYPARLLVEQDSLRSTGYW